MTGTPNYEALKEIARWAVLFVASWVITQVLLQIVLVPEAYTLKVWLFTFVIPLRAALTTGLTLAGRYIDKLLFERDKNRTKWEGEKSKGLLPF